MINDTPYLYHLPIILRIDSLYIRLLRFHLVISYFNR